MSVEKLRERVSEIRPYSPSQYVEQLADKLGISLCEVLKLDANENLFLSKHFMQQVMIESSYEVDPRLYPVKESDYLREQVAKLNAIKPDQVILASGGDQVIELLYTSLLGKTGSICAVSPTFSMYPRAAKQRQVEYVEVMLNDDFSIDVESVLEKSEGASLLLLCNPNNPTGNQFDKDDVLKMVDGFNGFVLVDEAYADYGEYSLVGENESRDNLIILRTFSKAYGAAGLRLGYCVTNSELAGLISTKCQMPYAVPAPILRAGSILLRNQDLVTKMIESAKEEREALIESMNQIEGVKAYPSDTNFVLFETEKPYKEVNKGLQERGILVRGFGKILGRENCMRVTVAPRPLMERFIEALKEAVK